MYLCVLFWSMSLCVLCSQLVTQRSLEWLKSVRKSHESVSVSSFSQAEAINFRGVYTVQVDQGDALPTLESCFKVYIPPDQGRQTAHDDKTYRLEEIKDLQSKLVLVAARAESGGGTLQDFMGVSVF